MWNKLENLYMTKSHANHLYMKQCLYLFKIGDDKNVHVQIDEFIKILDDLENIDVKMEDKDKAPWIIFQAHMRIYKMTCYMAENKQYRSKNKTKYKCFHCQNEGNYKKGCPDRRKKTHEKSKENAEAVVACDIWVCGSSAYHRPKLLQRLDSWFRCSFHTCPFRSWFESFTDVERLVLLGNNILCTVTCIGTIRLKMHNGVEREF